MAFIAMFSERFVFDKLQIAIIGECERPAQTPQRRKPGSNDPGFLYKFFRRRPTLPHSLPCSTIGAKELNFRVRDGNGCFLFAIATEKSVTI